MEIAGKATQFLSQVVASNFVHASFNIDRLCNQVGFVTTIVQALSVITITFVSPKRLECTSSNFVNITMQQNTLKKAMSAGQRAYVEVACLAVGWDQSKLEEMGGNSSRKTEMTNWANALEAYMVQTYYPFVYILEAILLYMPFFLWSKTYGQQLRQEIQFVVDLSFKLLGDGERKEAKPGETEEQRKERTLKKKLKRKEGGRSNCKDCLNECELKNRLRKWYCRSKHTRWYYVMQIGRISVCLFFIGFFNFFPGFRYQDIRNKFKCALGSKNYDCLLVNANLYTASWSGNIGILCFCLVIACRQIFYRFPILISCRCLQCKSKRCLPTCGKACQAHYFQRILGVTCKPKRDASDCCNFWCLPFSHKEGFEQLQTTDYYSPRLSDRFYISAMCYENYHLLKGILPDPTVANKGPREGMESMANVAQLASTFQNLADDASAHVAKSDAVAKESLSKWSSSKDKLQKQ